MIFQHHFLETESKIESKVTLWCFTVIEVQTKTKRAHKHVEKPQPKSLVLLYLSSKSCVDLTRQIANLSRHQQATLNPNYLREKRRNAYSMLYAQETHCIRSCRALQYWQTPHGRSFNVL
jgi:hypothetical protein